MAGSAAGASKPQNQKPKAVKKSASAAAREAEAGDGFVTVEHAGLTLRIPIAGKIPLKAVLAFKAGDEAGGTELLLGADQWKAFLETDPTVDDFNSIGEKLQEAAGN